MSEFGSLGRVLVIVGAVVVVVGLLLLFFDHIPLLGKLPGDFIIKRKNFTLYFPLATSIVLSLILSLILYLLKR